MRVGVISVLLLLLGLVVTVQSAGLRSALRLCDSTDCDIDLLYINGVYNLSIPLNYIKTFTSTSFCYRRRPVSNATNGTCDLSGFDSAYTCYSIDSTTISAPKLYSYTADAALNPTNTTKTLSMTLAPSPTAVSMNLTGIITNSIYQFVMGNVYNLATDTGSKLAFFQTFPPLGTIDQSSNIFMQRYFVCFQYYYNSYYNYNIIFYGGVVRHGINTMYIAYVTFLSSDTGTVMTTSSLNLWAGVDFSNSHSSRDMVGFSSGYGYIYDLYSLYGSAPFNDTAININGTMDFQVSYTSNTGAASLSYYASAGGYRMYDTSDTNGDEIIRKKINFNWCYAVGYSTGTTAIQPTDKIKHSFVSCWIPNVVVWESTAVFSMMLLLFVVVNLA